MRLEALHHYTSALPLVKPKEISDLTGHDTTHSILSGVEYGIQFEMEGFITAYKKQYKNLKVVMTGGDALRLAKPLKSNIFAAPHLIHIGLYEILKKNLA
jgi:type III pantothenate kinase